MFSCRFLWWVNTIFIIKLTEITEITRISFFEAQFFSILSSYLFPKVFIHAKFREILMSGPQEIGVIPRVSVEGSGLWTSVHYKPTDSHSYLLYSSSHPSHVKNSIPYSQFLRLRRRCSEDSDFSLKSEEMCEFFDKRGYPASVIEAGHHRAQQIDRQSALKTSQKENSNKIPFTLTFHPHNHAVKSIILKKL